MINRERDSEFELYIIFFLLFDFFISLFIDVFEYLTTCLID